jgi:hypothetical protein
VAKPKVIFSRALLVRKPFVDQIVDGSKTWEMRSRSNSITGPIGLVEAKSGYVVGVALISKSLARKSAGELVKTRRKHRMSLAEIGKPKGYKVPWPLRLAVRLKKPVAYRHNPGAVTWVRLTLSVSKKIAKQLPSWWLKKALVVDEK